MCLCALLSSMLILVSLLIAVLNVAAGKAPMQSSVVDGGIPQKAVDGSTSSFFDASTCSLTEVERAPWWYVNLLEPYMVQLVRIDFGQSCCGELLGEMEIRRLLVPYWKATRTTNLSRP